MPSRIQLRRGTAAEWVAANPRLAAGEPGLETDTFKIKVGNGLSGWTSLTYTVPHGGGSVGSVTSDKLSAVSANAKSAKDIVSNNLSVLAAATSVLSIAVSNLTSAHNALSNAHSALSVALSNEISARNNSVSVASAAATSADTHASAASAAATSVDARVNSIFSVLGTQQIRAIAATGNVNSSVFTKVSGLSLSLASTATYRIIGDILLDSSLNQSIAIGFTYPSSIAKGGMHMIANRSIFTSCSADTDPFNTASGRITRGYINQTGMSTLATAQLSYNAFSAGKGQLIQIEGLLRTGSTAGTLQLQARGGNTPGKVFFYVGSFVQAFKIQ